MLLPSKTLNAETLKEIREFGKFLMPYNFPKVSPEDEEEISILKSQDLVVDGYNVVISYSKADWDTHYLEVVQLTGHYSPFLPFSLVCKIGKKILGDKHLSYVDFIKNEQKVYCWTIVLDRENNAIPGPFKQELRDCTYEGLTYRLLK